MTDPHNIQPSPPPALPKLTPLPTQHNYHPMMDAAACLKHFELLRAQWVTDNQVAISSIIAKQETPIMDHADNPASVSQEQVNGINENLVRLQCDVKMLQQRLDALDAKEKANGK